MVVHCQNIAVQEEYHNVQLLVREILRFVQRLISHNAFQKGIAYAWCHCGKNIKRYRKEKVHQTKGCKKCKYKSKCGITDCRMLALVYNGDEKRSSPLTCAIAQNIVKNTEGQA